MTSRIENTGTRCTTKRDGEAPPQRDARPQRRAPRRHLVVVLLLAAAACPTHQRAASREALLQSLGDVDDAPWAQIPTIHQVMEARVAPLPLFDERAASEMTLLLMKRASAQTLDDVLARSDVTELASVCVRAAALGQPELVGPACGRALDVAPDHPLATSMAAALIASRDDVADIDEIVLKSGPRWRDACFATGAACGSFAAIVDEHMIRAAGRRGQTDVVRSMWQRSGRLVDAEITGPLADDPESVLANARERRATRIRAHRTMKVERHADDGVFAPALRSEGGVYRVRMSFNGGGRASISVQGEGAFVMHVDDQLLAERTLFASGSASRTVHHVVLTEGRHVVETTFLAEGPGDVLTVSVLDAQGNPLTSPRSERAGTWSRGATLASAVVVSDADTALTRLAMLTERRAGFFVDEKNALAAERALLAEHHGDVAALAMSIGNLMDDRSVPLQTRRSLAAPLVQRLAVLDDTHAGPALYAAMGKVDEHPEEALRIVQAAIEKRPSNRTLRRMAVRLALSVGDLASAVSSIEFLTSPVTSPLDLDLQHDVARATGDLVTAARVEAAREMFDDGQTGITGVRHLLTVGDTETALDRLRALANTTLGSPVEELLWDLLEVRAPTEALERMDAILDAFPLDRATWRRRASLTRGVNGNDAALTFVARAHRALGTSRELTDLQSELVGVAPWDEILKHGDAAIAAAIADPPPPSGHPVLFLVDDGVRVVADDSTSMGIQHRIARVDGRDGINLLGEISTSTGQEILRLRVVKPDGRVVEPDFHDALSDVSLSDLGVGDLIEIVSVGFVEWPLLGGMNFETRVLATSVPAISRRYTLQLPERMAKSSAFSLIARNGARPPETATLDDGRVQIRFVATDVEAVLPEEASVADEVVLPVVGYALNVDDENWARVRRAQWVAGGRTSSWFDDVAKKVVHGGPHRDHLVRVARFVSMRIEPGEVTDPLTALALGRGDRVSVARALLASLGFDVTPIGVDVPALSVGDGFPTSKQWSVRGIRVRLDDGAHFLIGDERLGELDAAVTLLQGARAIDLRVTRPAEGFFSFFADEAPLIFDLPDDVIDGRGTSVRLSLEQSVANGPLEGAMVIEIPKAMAGPLRRGLAAASDDDRRAFFEGILSNGLTPSTVTKVSIPSERWRGTDLTIGVEFVVGENGAKTGARFERIFPDGVTTALGLFPSLGRSLAHAARVRPLQTLPAREELTLTMSLHPSSAFTETPEGRRLRAGPVSLDLDVAVTDGTLVIHRVLEVTRARVSSSEWPTHRAQLARLLAQGVTPVAFLSTTKESMSTTTEPTSRVPAASFSRTAHAPSSSF